MKIALFFLSIVGIVFSGCKSDKLTMATAANFAPFEYISGGDFQGIDIDVAKIIASELGKELVIYDMEFDSVVQSVASKNADIALSGLTINKTRKQVIDFSDTYFNAAQMLIIKENDERFKNLKTKEDVIKAVNKAKSLKIGVQAGTTGEFYSKGDKDWGFDGFKNAETISFANGAMAVTAMLNNQLDVVIIDEMPARVLTKTNSGVELVDIALTDEEYAIAVSKGNEELLNKINEILRTIKQDGRMQDIINKYYVQQK